jgi:hypothetical protein
MTDQAFTQALDEIDRHLSRSAPQGLDALDGSQLCQTYRQVRGFLETILPFIEKIPVYGKKVAGAIRFLMSLADTVCPA